MKSPEPTKNGAQYGGDIGNGSAGKVRQVVLSRLGWPAGEATLPTARSQLQAHTTPAWVTKQNPVLQTHFFVTVTTYFINLQFLRQTEC